MITRTIHATSRHWWIIPTGGAIRRPRDYVYANRVWLPVSAVASSSSVCECFNHHCTAACLQWPYILHIFRRLSGRQLHALPTDHCDVMQWWNKHRQQQVITAAIRSQHKHRSHFIFTIKLSAINIRRHKICSMNSSMFLNWRLWIRCARMTSPAIVCKLMKRLISSVHTKPT